MAQQAQAISSNETENRHQVTENWLRELLHTAEEGKQSTGDGPAPLNAYIFSKTCKEIRKRTMA